MKCVKCHRDLDAGEFSVCHKKVNGLASWCKLCTKEYKKKWYTVPVNHKHEQEKHKKRYSEKKLEISNKAALYYQKNREKIREKERQWKLNNPDGHHSKILKKFKITIDQYNQLLEKQHGKCAICSATTYGKKGAKRFAVDHSHKNGKIRGLLCMNCNSLLGQAKDDVKILLAAIKYLENNNVDI